MLDGVGGQRHAPAALPPGKTQYLLHMRLSGPQARSGRVRKVSPPPGFDPWTVQPITSRYTDWAVAVYRIAAYIYEKKFPFRFSFVFYQKYVGSTNLKNQFQSHPLGIFCIKVKNYFDLMRQQETCTFSTVSGKKAFLRNPTPINGFKNLQVTLNLFFQI